MAPIAKVGLVDDKVSLADLLLQHVEVNYTTKFVAYDPTEPFSVLTWHPLSKSVW